MAWPNKLQTSNLWPKDESHIVEMLVKGKGFFDSGMPCYYKTGTINEGEQLIRIDICHGE
jgi:hypothetical protein